MITVMTIDDSALVRRVLGEILDGDPDIEVIDSAADPYIAVEKLRKHKPDVIILDIEMPRMDGLTFLRKLMSQHPIPVIICSSKSEEGSRNAMTALEYGAVEIVTKPHVGTKTFLYESSVRLIDSVKAAASIPVKKISLKGKLPSVPKKLSADAVIPARSIRRGSLETTEKVIVMGASTGGTEALREVLENMPLDCPGIVIVQHMPEQFTKSFAKRLDDLCQISVKEAEDNDTVIPGHALICPGNKHILLKRSGARYYVEITDGPLVNRHRPSVDVLFRSASHSAGDNAIGVILTGMGDDGAKGMLELKNSGARTIAQDEESCVVYGMPKAAVELKAADVISPLKNIHEVIYG